MTVETLDGRLIKVSVDHIVTPKTVIKIEGEGMPILSSIDETINQSAVDSQAKLVMDDPLEP